MSKSKGNVIDPLEVIDGATLKALNDKLLKGNLDAKEVKIATKGQTEDFPNGIAQCGTDALRFGLTAYTQQGKNVNLDIDRIVGYRQFCNKLWQASRFCLEIISKDFNKKTARNMDILSHPGISTIDKWVLTQLNDTIKVVNDSMAQYNFADATTAIYQFWLNTFCGTYMESTKPVVRGNDGPEKECTCQVLQICLETGLLLTHPFMPFVTEELWQRMPWRSSVEDDKASIMISKYPEYVPKWENSLVKKQFTIASLLLNTARSIRGDYNVAFSKPLKVFCYSDDAETIEAVNVFTPQLKALTNLGSLQVLPTSAPSQPNCVVVVASAEMAVHIDLSGILDLDNELEKLNKSVVSVARKVEKLQTQVNHPSINEKKKESFRAKLAVESKKLEHLRGQVAKFEKMKENQE